MFAFLCRIPFNPIRIIDTPPTTIFQNGMPNVVLESPSNVFRAPYHSTPPPPPASHQLHAPSCTQPCLTIFIFWIAYISSPNSRKHVYFLKIPIPYHFFRSGISNPLLTPHPVFFTMTNPTQSDKPLFDLYYNQIQHLFPLSIFYFSYPALPVYPFKMTLTPLKRRRKYLYSIFINSDALIGCYQHRRSIFP